MAFPDSAPDTTLLRALEADLRGAHFTASAVRTLLGEEADAARTRGILAPARRALAHGEPGSQEHLSTLVRLFLLAESVQEEQLSPAFPALGIAGAVAAGLIETSPQPGYFRALLALNPTELTLSTAWGESEQVHWWLLSDVDEHLVRGPLRKDHVLGIGGATRSLLSIAFPGLGGRVLDLGTGCGVIALAAARSATQVIATDVSQRALYFAAANAALNGFTNIEFRLGDRYQPVRNERFDQILSNPPFVITPRTEGMPLYEYRDGGLAGDDLVASVLGGAQDHLLPGGTLQALANWEYRWGANGLERALNWVDSTGAAEDQSAPSPSLHAWIIERQRLSPLAYAETWSRDGGALPGSDLHEHMVNDWLEDFTARRVLGIGFGFVLLRAPQQGEEAQSPVRRSEIVSGPLPEAGPLGGHLQAAFRAGVAVSALSAEQLSREKFCVSDGVIEQRDYEPGAEDPSAIRLVQSDGLGRVLSVDTALAATVGVSDGELTAGEIAGALAGLLAADEAEFRTALLPGITELVWHGVLEPQRGSGAP